MPHYGKIPQGSAGKELSTRWWNAVGGRRAPQETRSDIGSEPKSNAAAKQSADDSDIYASLVAACSQTNPMALQTCLGPLRASLALDTGAAVNVLSERAYQSIKRASRGGKFPLRPNDLVLKSVNNETLSIVGVVTLPVKLGKGTHTLKLDFYVVSSFSLPADGLLGLTSLKSHKIIIKPDQNAILYQGRCFKAMD